LLSLGGEKRVWQETGAIPDMRNKRGRDFTVSADGGMVRFGLGIGGINPVLFDVARARLSDQPEPVSGLAAPEIESLKLTDWINNYSAKLNGKPLELLRLEESRCVAIAPGRDRFALGTDWNLRAFASDGKSIWSKRAPSIV